MKEGNMTQDMLIHAQDAYGRNVWLTLEASRLPATESGRASLVSKAGAAVGSYVVEVDCRKLLLELEALMPGGVWTIRAGAYCDYCGHSFDLVFDEQGIMTNALHSRRRIMCPECRERRQNARKTALAGME